MIQPNFSVVSEQLEAGHYRLVLEPLQQGYGHTLGNALRRVLLSSLPGAAITAVRVRGVEHQFTTLKGMSEDIVQLVLNLKSVRIRVEGDGPVTLKLESTGPGTVTAGDIQPHVGVTVANPELVLAHLSDAKATLSMELTVEKGLGYSQAEERKSNVVGTIPVDALFSPIKRVNPSVASTRVGRRTDFDKLTLDIWTDGTITGKEALDVAAKTLVDQFTQVFSPAEGTLPPRSEGSAIVSSNEVLKLTVEELDLPTRIANALRKGGYKTVGDLVAASRAEVVKVKNLGERSVGLVETALAQKSLAFSDN